jgi:phosphate starvation-inducible protein PhoH and related proteins
LTEKTIILEEVSLIDFLGVDNQTIREVSATFPESKIISRGNEIFIKGTQPEVARIETILNSLIDHCQKFGKISSVVLKNQLGLSELSSENHEPNGQHLDDADVLVYGNRGMVIKVRTENQRKMVVAAAENDLLFAVGPAGTGKTYTAVAIAVKALKNKEVKKIIITRPAVEAGENLGFLPGDLKEKIDPYLRPIYDALDDMIPPDKLKLMIESRVIEIAPLAYMRGRTLNNAFILLDEAQNTTSMQLKMFLTRMGAKSKTIITGDQTQIDLPKSHASGLKQGLQILQGIKGIAFVTLDGTDVLRHRLVKDIIKAYEKLENI